MFGYDYIENEFTEALLDHFEKTQVAHYNLNTYNCLLEGVFTPNMEDRYRRQSMIERIRNEEPDVFDTDVSAEQMREWIYC